MFCEKILQMYVDTFCGYQKKNEIILYLSKVKIKFCKNNFHEIIPGVFFKSCTECIAMYLSIHHGTVPIVQLEKLIIHAYYVHVS